MRAEKAFENMFFGLSWCFAMNLWSLILKIFTIIACTQENGNDTLSCFQIRYLKNRANGDVVKSLTTAWELLT